MEEKVPDQGSVLAGFVMAMLCQIFFGVVGFLPLTRLGETFGREEYNPLVFGLSSWGLTQWVGIVPLIFAMRRKGNRRTVTGLLVTGCVGLLLSSACASVFWTGRVGG